MQRKREKRAREDLKEENAQPIWQRIRKALLSKRKKPFVSERKPGQPTALQKETRIIVSKRLRQWSVDLAEFESQENQKWQNRLKRKTIMISKD